MNFRSAKSIARHPDRCATEIGRKIFGASATVISARNGWVTLEISFTPPAALPGYPVELVRLTIPPRGTPVAVALGHDRGFLHRYPRAQPTQISDWGVPSLEFLVGGLCLWFPDDPVRLRWSWIKGFMDFVQIVQRHLWYEEFWRRTGSWPVEDAHEAGPTEDAKAA